VQRAAFISARWAWRSRISFGERSRTRTGRADVGDVGAARGALEDRQTGLVVLHGPPRAKVSFDANHGCL
jgi:hypothetical protein